MLKSVTCPGEDGLIEKASSCRKCSIALQQDEYQIHCRINGRHTPIRIPRWRFCRGYLAHKTAYVAAVHSRFTPDTSLAGRQVAFQTEWIQAHPSPSISKVFTGVLRHLPITRCGAHHILLPTSTLKTALTYTTWEIRGRSSGKEGFSLVLDILKVEGSEWDRGDVHDRRGTRSLVYRFHGVDRVYKQTYPSASPSRD